MSPHLSKFITVERLAEVLGKFVIIITVNIKVEHYIFSNDSRLSINRPHPGKIAPLVKARYRKTSY